MGEKRVGEYTQRLGAGKGPRGYRSPVDKKIVPRREAGDAQRIISAPAWDQGRVSQPLRKRA